MKKIARNLVVAVLGWQVRRLRHKNNFKIIAVVGSIGKTSTKFAIAETLKDAKLVRYQQGNYNDPVSVPLVLFGHDIPSLFNPLAWVRLFLKNEKQLRREFPYDVAVLELGTDRPGDIDQFAAYLHCDIAVVTALTPEHMEFFGDLDNVAKEELSITNYSSELIVNADLCDEKYIKQIKKPLTTYGLKGEHKIQKIKTSRGGTKFTFEYNQEAISFTQKAYSTPEVYSAAAALVVAEKLGLTTQQAKRAIARLEPVSGRMQRLNGIKNSLILDETYNASPVAMKAALDTVYAIKAPQKIVILGNMNELGEHSKAAHTEIGEYCESEQLDLVVTIGPDANEYLAPAAKARGCVVHTFDNPYAAGNFIKKNIEKGALVMAKGSQNRVYAEEAVKLLLADPKDESKLVRQSRQWLKKKEKSFNRA